MLYAAALVPVGLLADKADRPRLLAAGIAAWSVLTMAASQVGWGCCVARIYMARLRNTCGLTLCRDNAADSLACPVQVNGFAALIVLRIGFAIAQAAQNPVCFGRHFPHH